MSRKRHKHQQRKPGQKKSQPSTELMLSKLVQDKEEPDTEISSNKANQHKEEIATPKQTQGAFSTIRPMVMAVPAFLANVTAIGAKTITTYFSYNGTDYKTETDSTVDEFTQFVNLIENGICGVNPNVTSVPIDYVVLDHIQNAREYVFAEFFRGLRQVAHEEIEACIKGLLDAAYAVYTKKLAKDEIKIGIGVGIFMASVIGVLGLVGGACYLSRRWRHHQASLESGGAPDPATNLSEREPLLSKKSLFTIKEELKKLTLAERLKIINVDINQYPEAQRFICPITQEVMENPMITDDGNSYDEADLKKQKESDGRCPLDLKKKITFMVPNNNLRAQIIEFVEKHEAEAKNKLPKAPTSGASTGMPGLRRSF